MIYGQGWYFAAAELVAFGSLAALVRSDAGRLGEFAVPLAVSAFLFWGLPLSHARCRKERVAWWSSAAALLLHFLLLYSIAESTWGRSPLGAVAVLGAVLTAVSVRGVISLTSEPEARLELLALFGGLTLAFVTASVPLLLENEWLTLSWAAEVAALAWLRRRVPHGGLILAAALLAAGVSVRLVANEPSGPTMLEARPRSSTITSTRSVSPHSRSSARNACSRRTISPSASFPGGPRLRRGVAAFRADERGNRRLLLDRGVADVPALGRSLAEDMTYSLAWGAFAIVLMLVAWPRNAAPRASVR